MPVGTRVRHAEYAFVTRQSRKGGVCPFCNVLHGAADGKALAGDCPGIYVRRRKAAFVVVGLVKGRAGTVGGEFAEPTGRNLERAISAAEIDWASR